MVMESAQDQFPVGLRVLVVDDDPTCLSILEIMLQRCFYNVMTCREATIALAMLRENKHQFDLVISDVHMPDMDGFKLLELIGLEMNIPVIMMSVDGEFSVVLKGVIHGACDYLLKPVRIESLRNIWQHVIRKKQIKNKEAEHFDMEETGQLRHISEQLEFINTKKRKEMKDHDLDTEDQPSLKKQRVVWSIQLHEQFVSAVNQLGIDKAVPKRILEMMNIQGLTRENVASHLQKYRLYLKRLSYEQNHAFNIHGAEFRRHPTGLPFWEEFLMPARSNELSPRTYTAACSGFADGLSFPNSSSVVRVGRPPGYLQISAVTEAHLSKGQYFSNVLSQALEGESPNPNRGERPNPDRSEPTQIMPTASSNQIQNPSFNDLVMDFTHQLNQKSQRYNLQPATEIFDIPNAYPPTLADSTLKRLNPSSGGVSKDSLCQHANQSGPVFGGHLTETACQGMAATIFPNGKRESEFLSQPSTKIIDISKFEENNLTDGKHSFDMLRPASSLSNSHLGTLHSGFQNRIIAQNSESTARLRTNLSVNTQIHADHEIKVDWETQTPRLWQGTDRRPTSGPFACSTQVSTGYDVDSCMAYDPQIVHGLNGLGSDVFKLHDVSLIQHEKFSDDFGHSIAHANLKFKGGNRLLPSGMREKKQSGSILLAPFLSDNLLSSLLKEDSCLQHQKPAFSEYDISMEEFSKESLYVN